MCVFVTVWGVLGGEPRGGTHQPRKEEKSTWKFHVDFGVFWEFCGFKIGLQLQQLRAAAATATGATADASAASAIAKDVAVAVPLQQQQQQQQQQQRQKHHRVDIGQTMRTAMNSSKSDSRYQTIEMSCVNGPLSEREPANIG